MTVNALVCQQCWPRFILESRFGLCVLPHPHRLFDDGEGGRHSGSGDRSDRLDSSADNGGNALTERNVAVRECLSRHKTLPDQLDYLGAFGEFAMMQAVVRFHFGEIVLLHDIGRVLNRSCLLQNMRRENVLQVMGTMRQQALDRTPTGIGIINMPWRWMTVRQAS